MPRTQLIGIVAPKPSGDYDDSVSYQILNIVRYNYASYIALQNAPIGVTPEDTSYWQLLALDGEGGGAVDSVNGKTGVVVLDAEDVLDASQLEAVNRDTTTGTTVGVDSTPTSGSSNLITSGGVYAYIASLNGNGVAY
ncbi:MAG: hypothetical protein KBS59_04070 [Clostridiales bacterium]|nr:hypothetical protein [Clostridiales bacterium]